MMQVVRQRFTDTSGTAFRAAAAVVVAVLLVAAAWAMTGPAPRPAPSGPAAPARSAPPMVFPAQQGSRSGHVAAAIRDWNAGRLDRAARGFAEAALTAPDAIEPQVGQAFALWTTDGPMATLKALDTLVASSGNDPYATLHLGIAQLAAARPAADADRTLERARQVARAAGAHHLARRADDLLHPRQVPGYPPVAAVPREAREAGGDAAVRRLAKVSAGDDRDAALRAARRYVRHPDPVVRAAAIAASYDKARPAVAVKELRALATDSPDVPVVRLQLAYVLVWTGDRRAAADALRAVVRTAPGSAVARHAARLQAVLDARR